MAAVTWCAQPWQDLVEQSSDHGAIQSMGKDEQVLCGAVRNTREYRQTAGPQNHSNGGTSPTCARKMYNVGRRSAQHNEEGQHMRKLITAGLSLSAMLTALGETKAYVNYPWCIVGDTRGTDCVFSTLEQCTADGRNRGFGSQCIRNPSYNPALPSVVPGPFTKPDPVRSNTAHR